MVHIKKIVRNGIIIGICLGIVALIIFNDVSFHFLGIGIVCIGISLLYLINHKK
jgi:1,4-dihydroxy-2-naphthoate octaprenyltransferase